MSVAGKWRIVEMPGFPADYPDFVETAYILFEKEGGGEFAFGACTGHIWEASSAVAASIDFSWDGSDEMDEVSGEGEAELQSDGSLHGEIRYRHGDELPSSPENGLLQQPASSVKRLIFGILLFTVMIAVSLTLIADAINGKLAAYMLLAFIVVCDRIFSFCVFCIYHSL